MLSSSSDTDQTPAAVSDCLECVGTISQRYMLQPTSLDSEIHARMSMKISERSKKDRRYSSSIICSMMSVGDRSIHS